MWINEKTLEINGNKYQYFNGKKSKVRSVKLFANGLQ